MKLFRVFVFLILFSSIQAQKGFVRIDTIKVSDASIPLKNPWAGGLNFPQFSAIDLNFDGIKDLFVFDRTGNKIITYLNHGTSNTIDYQHAPEYQTKFPFLHDWVRLVDYNCDNKEDIFAYATGGIEMYKNVSNLTDGLKFQLVENLLLSNYFPPNGTPTNIYANYEDIPEISDIDNDGDMDVIAISFFSSKPEYHQNKSIELYGVCDSLNSFEMNTDCWGNFAESIRSNDVNLGISCKGMGKTEEAAKTNHSLGTCILCLDIDGDGDKDFAQGVESFKNYLMLTNGGTSANANMIAKDVNFPSYDYPVNLSSFPCGYHLDLNNDGLKDLIVSPSSQNISENYTSIWYYKNVGSVTTFSLSFQQNNFLQSEMIEVGEGAYPVFFDYDADGLLDLLIGNYGYYDTSGTPKSKIALYKNTGTINHPQFNLISRDFANLSTANLINICPTFGDLDNDGDHDMIIGDNNGRLHYYQNTAGAGNTANFVLAQANYPDASGVIIDVGQLAVPQLIDVNKDGKKDLIIGAQNGKIAYYINNGTVTSPNFSKVTSNFAGVNVNKPNEIGCSYPCLFESSPDIYNLIVGSGNGYLYYYDNIQDSSSTLVDSMYMDIKEGIRTAPNVADINNDGLKDLAVGNYSGGLGFYGGTIMNSVDERKIQLAFDIFPNPSSEEITICFKSCFTIGDKHKKVLHVVDITGREVLHQDITGCETKVDVSDLNSGMYFYTVYYSSVTTGQNYQFSGKFVQSKQ